MSHHSNSSKASDSHSPEMIHGKSEMGCRNKSFSSSCNSGGGTNPDCNSESQVYTVTNEKKAAVNTDSQSTSSCATETPKNGMIPLCQPSQFSNQYNNNTSVKT